MSVTAAVKVMRTENDLELPEAAAILSELKLSVAADASSCISVLESLYKATRRTLPLLESEKLSAVSVVGKPSSGVPATSFTLNRAIS